MTGRLASELLAQNLYDVLILEARGFHRGVKGRDPQTLTAADIADETLVPKPSPHRIASGEGRAIISVEGEEANSDKAHRELAHHLSCSEQAFVSESTVLRVLRSVALVRCFQGRAPAARAVPT